MESNFYEVTIFVYDCNRLCLYSSLVYDILFTTTISTSCVPTVFGNKHLFCVVSFLIDVSCYFTSRYFTLYGHEEVS